MRELLIAIVLFVIQIALLFANEIDIKNQLLKQGRTHFLFISDIRVDNPRVIEYIEKGSK